MYVKGEKSKLIFILSRPGLAQNSTPAQINHYYCSRLLCPQYPRQFGNADSPTVFGNVAFLQYNHAEKRADCDTLDNDDDNRKNRR
jgi:hypothetical protein